jgi:hypothetical protein
MNVAGPRQDPTQLGLSFAKAADNILHHDHRPIDDDAEVDRPQTQQVGTDAVLHHAADGKQHRQWDDHGNDQRAAEIAEQKKQHRNHQCRTFQQVGSHRMQCGIHQLGAIVDGARQDTLWQALLDLLQACRNPLRHRATVLSHQHERGPEDHFLAILRCRPRARFGADLYTGHVADMDGYTIACRHHDLADVLQVTQPTRCADQILLPLVINPASTGGTVVALQGQHHIVQCEAIRQQSHRVGADFILFAIPTNCIDLGDTFDCGELRLYHPVLDLAQIHRGERRAIRFQGAGLGLDDPHEDLTEAGGDRAHRRFGQTFGQARAHFLQPFADQLAGEIDVGIVLEHNRHLRQPIA